MTHSLPSAGASPSVHPLELRGHCTTDLSSLLPLDDSSESAEYNLHCHTPLWAFRHSGWHAHRVRVWQSLCRTAASSTRRCAFRDCGRHCYVLRSLKDPSKHVLAFSACHDRLCVPCANGRSKSIANAVAVRLHNATCRFLTLTLRSAGEPLAPLLDRLYDAFSRLKRTRFWRKRVGGGVAFLEVTRNPNTGFWHPHLHVLTHGTYIDQPQLQALWHRLTKTSHIVDIRLVRCPDHAIRYVCKYASKPCDPKLSHNPSTLDELTVALQGRRMVISFGDWADLKLTAKPTKGEWVNTGSIDAWAERAATGDDSAWQVLCTLAPEHAALLVQQAQTRAPPPRPETPHPLEQLRIDYGSPSTSIPW